MVATVLFQISILISQDYAVVTTRMQQNSHSLISQIPDYANLPEAFASLGAHGSHCRHESVNQQSVGL